MAVTLRLARHGQKNRPFYRVVATDSANKRDGKFIEVIGTYNTMTEPATVRLNEEKVKKWLGRGAQLSSVVRRLVIKNFPGIVEAREEHQTKKIQDARRKRKERAKNGSSGKKAKAK